MKYLLPAATALFAWAFLSGCATRPPGTPGYGFGANYTPVIDLAGVNMSRYSTDLDACREYAKSIDSTDAAVSGAIVGALIGAAISARYGVQGRANTDNAIYGASAGGAAASGRALNTQQRIITNCMAGRGYRTLDAPYAVITGGNSPYAPAAVAPVAAAPALSTAPLTAEPAAQAAPLVQPVPPVATAAGQTSTAPPAPTVGKDSFQAERLPEVRACQPQPRAVLSAKGPGMETYTVACANGDALAVRCEFGNCRVLR